MYRKCLNNRQGRLFRISDFRGGRLCERGAYKKSEFLLLVKSFLNIIVRHKNKKKAGLVEHLPIEISKPMKQSVDVDKKNLLMATVVGKRKTEVGLVTPAMVTNQKITAVLNNEVLKRKEKYKHFEMKFESVNDYKNKGVFN